MNKCPKCGGRSPRVEWHGAGPETDPTVLMARGWYADRASTLCRDPEEHLHYACKCGYHWTGPTREQAKRTVA